ncbi:MAG TPA: hypothetical protein VGI65_11395 [Steroidobacteraceae bacterium]|jgi:hypothetical protein
MASNDTTRKGEENFSFGVTEMRDMRQGNQPRTLALDARAQKKNQDAAKGFDPYNTSGSFDRKKNWLRVGKR